MQRIRLLRRGGQALPQHDRNQPSDPLRDGLVAEIVDRGRPLGEGLGEGEDGVDVSFQHRGRLVAGEVAELDGKVAAGGAVVARGGAEDVDVGLYEAVGEVPGGAKVEELELLGAGVEEEVGPVGVGLHEAELDDLPQAEAQDLGADPIFLLLGEIWRFGDANALHSLHGENLGTRGFVYD